MEDERQDQQHFELLQSKECMEPTDRFLKLHRKCIYNCLTLLSGSEKIWQCFGDQGVFTSFSSYSPLILDMKLFWSGLSDSNLNGWKDYKKNVSLPFQFSDICIMLHIP